MKRSVQSQILPYQGTLPDGSKVLGMGLYKPPPVTNYYTTYGNNATVINLCPTDKPKIGF